MKAEAPAWHGRTVVCIASGPSLTSADCEAVRAAGHPVIVTNTSFRLAPWADVLFAFDSRWWLEHIAEVREGFPGKLVTVSQVVSNLGVATAFGAPWFKQFGNSGACAISLAMGGGAKRVVLIGYDCGKGPRGEAHWHGNHPPKLSNCASIARWPAMFARVAEEAKRQHVQVINASRATTLECFERMDLSEALQ